MYQHHATAQQNVAAVWRYTLEIILCCFINTNRVGSVYFKFVDFRKQQQLSIYKQRPNCKVNITAI